MISSKPSNWIIANDSKWRSLNDTYFTKASVQYNQSFSTYGWTPFLIQNEHLFFETLQQD